MLSFLVTKIFFVRLNLTKKWENEDNDKQKINSIVLEETPDENAFSGYSWTMWLKQKHLWCLNLTNLYWENEDREKEKKRL